MADCWDEGEWFSDIFILLYKNVVNCKIGCS